MRNEELPAEINGEWIWISEARSKQERYLFFRKEITLDTMPAAAELWITARTLFHIYVNGRHLSFGPPLHPLAAHTYVCRYDVTHLLETGVNVIAVLAHNTRVARFSARRQADGFWAQLNGDGKPLVWTNSSWRVLPGDCYAENRPRRSVAIGFAEKVDFRRYPLNWQAKEFSAVRWVQPDWHQPMAAKADTLVPLNTPEFSAVSQPAVQIAARGVGRPASAVTHVSFQARLHERGAGVYAAETYVYAAVAGEVAFSLFSDSPYKFFCNRALVKEQGIVTLPAGFDIDAAGFLCFRQGQMAAPEGTMTLDQGWNHLCVCQLLEHGSPGFTLVFRGVDPAMVRFYRASGDDGLPGWQVAGPLRAPLATILGSLSLENLELTPYHPALFSPLDEAAHLTSFEFTARSTTPEPVPEAVTLRSGQYVIFDFGQTYYGCTGFEIRGSDEDAVDVLWGERLADGRILPYQDGRYNVDSLVLGPERYDWLACAPRGCRYLMVLAREAKKEVTLRNVILCRRGYAREKAGAFECSDSVFNRIWETSSRTLDITLQDAFLDSACKETAQYIPDAMIQSLATYMTLGSFELAAKGLREFAAAQVETGEMPAVCPSDSYVNIPDYALLWPVWLQKHYLLSGDRAFLETMVSALENLFNYFAYLGDPGTGLLSNLDTRFGAPCFLDHGSIDRRGTVTGLNALYCRALLSGATLFEELGHHEEAGLLRQRAAHVAARLRTLTWDAATGLFADSWHDGRRSDAYAWQTNILAVYGGVAQPEHYHSIFSRFFDSQPPFQRFPGDSSDNPYFKFFVIETAVAIGYKRLALNLIRWYWGSMLEQGATTWWEFHDPQSVRGVPAEGSLCHGYGVSPCYFLIAELVGLRPASPGYKTVYFNPFLDGIQWVKAEVPTPQGIISVQWRREATGELDVTVNANYPLELIPVLDPAVAAVATFHVSDDVSVLAEPEESASPT